MSEREWVTLTGLKVDLGVTEDDSRDDEQLAQQLGAAAAFVERVHAGRFAFGLPNEALDLPVPDEDMVLGTLRLAGRWYTRRRSPDGLVAMAELGAARVPSVDPDIDRMLRIGRYRGPVFA